MDKRSILEAVFRHGVKAEKLDLVSEYHQDIPSATLGIDQALTELDKLELSEKELHKIICSETATVVEAIITAVRAKREGK